MSRDRIDQARRSENMAKIRGNDTKPELLLRKALWRRGLRYRLKFKLVGRPDVVFTHAKVAVFVDGCFWHGCPLHYQAPHGNAAFWKQKLHSNQVRDAHVNAELERSGWTSIRFWEHQIEADLQSCVNEITSRVIARKSDKQKQ